MPELPEVQTILNVLEKNLKGETVTSIDLKYAKLLEKDSPYDISILQGKKFLGFSRVGKYLCLEFSEGYYLIIHLRMEGKFHLYKEDVEPVKHTHMLIVTENNYVHYLDTRKFSRMCVTKDIKAYFIKKKLGIDGLSDSLSVESIEKPILKSSKPIKSILLDQSIITGIGNIYADEILYASKIHPLQMGRTLNNSELQAIVSNTHKILSNALKAGGTTIRSYTSSLNVNGRFQVELGAYGRKGKPCNTCNTLMESIKIGGRTSTFCPICQRIHT